MKINTDYWCSICRSPIKSNPHYHCDKCKSANLLIRQNYHPWLYDLPDTLICQDCNFSIDLEK